MLLGRPIVIRFSLKSFYVGLGMVQYILLRKHLGIIPYIFPSPTTLPQNGIARGGETYNPQQSASCGDLQNQTPLHSSEISASLFFPFLQTETGTPNRRHVPRHTYSAKTPSTQKEKNKEARPHRPVTAGSPNL